MGSIDSSFVRIDLSTWLSNGKNPEGVELAWLGQAGFVIRSSKVTLAIDPYLSDSLAEKYKGSYYPHIRMMEAPLAPEELRGVDFLISTHGHTDHMDGGTLIPIYDTMPPHPSFIAPRSEVAKANSRGVPLETMVLLNAGESFTSQQKGFSITAIPAAHEELTQDSYGNYLHLGYIIDIGGIKIYHSGDSIPYPSLSEKLKEEGVEVALLPVNGRDAERAARSVPGNFTLNEAIDLTRSCNARLLIVHHFGLFAFNTVALKVIEAARDMVALKGINLIIPKVGTLIKLK